MKRILEALKDILKELLIIGIALFVLTAFLLPFLSIWCGLFKNSYEIELAAISIRTNIIISRLENTGDFFWDLDDYVPINEQVEEEG